MSCASTPHCDLHASLVDCGPAKQNNGSYGVPLHRALLLLLVYSVFIIVCSVAITLTVLNSGGWTPPLSAPHDSAVGGAEASSRGSHSSSSSQSPTVMPLEDENEAVSTITSTYLPLPRSTLSSARPVARVSPISLPPITPNSSSCSSTSSTNKCAPRLSSYVSMGSVTTSYSTNLSHVLADVGVGGDGLPVMSYFANNSLVIGHCSDSDCVDIHEQLISISNSSELVGGVISQLAIGIDALPLVVDILTAINDSVAGPLHYIRVTHCENAACTSYSTLVVDDFPILGDECSIFGGVGIAQTGLAMFTFYDPHNMTIWLAECADVACSAVSVAHIYTPDRAGPLDAPAVCGESHSFLITPLYSDQFKEQVRLSVVTTVRGVLMYIYVEASGNGVGSLGNAIYGPNTVSSATQMLLPNGKSMTLNVRLQPTDYSFYPDYYIDLIQSPTLTLGSPVPTAVLNWTCEPDESDVSHPFSIISQFTSADGLPNIVTFGLQLYVLGGLGPTYVILHCADWKCSQIFPVEWSLANQWQVLAPSFATALRPDGTPVHFYRYDDQQYRLLLCPGKTCSPYMA